MGCSLLTKVLSATVNLHVLQMRGMEPPFQSHLAVYKAVTKLDTLKVLSLYYISETCLKALSQLQGKPMYTMNTNMKEEQDGTKAIKRTMAHSRGGAGRNSSSVTDGNQSLLEVRRADLVAKVNLSHLVSLTSWMLCHNMAHDV
ncbi:hypothetical protein BD309DRAFT_1023863 [Dichomitus squalens]|nr:hypothetical protein BD309DRAFT_1023863 [Dichomitus squalens]